MDNQKEIERLVGEEVKRILALFNGISTTDDFAQAASQLLEFGMTMSRAQKNINTMMERVQKIARNVESMTQPKSKVM